MVARIDVVEPAESVFSDGARIPAAKIFFNCDLLPGVLKGEDEYIVIGGVYDIAISTL